MTEAPVHGVPTDPSLFLFDIGGTLFLCPAAAVEAVTSYEAPMPLPRVPAHVLGLVTYDQRALVLVDLGGFLHLPGARRDAFTRTLVVRAGPYRVGLPVSSALGVVELAADVMTAQGNVFTDRVGEYVLAEAQTEAGLGGVLDLERILEAARV